MRAETFVRQLEDSGATVERLADGDLLVTGSGRRVAVRLLDQPITATAVVDAYVRGLSSGVAPGLAGRVEGDARRWAERFGVALYDAPEEPTEVFDLGPLAVAARAAAALDAALAANVAVHPAEEFAVEAPSAAAEIHLLAPVDPTPLLAPVAAEASIASPSPEFTLVSEEVFAAPTSVEVAADGVEPSISDVLPIAVWEEIADAASATLASEIESSGDEPDAPAPTLAEVLFEIGAAPAVETLEAFPDAAFDAAEVLALVEAIESGETPPAFDLEATVARPPPAEVSFAPDSEVLAQLLGEAALPARPAAREPAFDALVALVGEARLPPRRIRAVAAAPDVVAVLFGEAKRPQPGPRFASEPAALVDLLGVAAPPARARPPAAPEALVALYGTAKPKLATPRARFPEPAADTLVTLLGPARRPHPVARVQFPAPKAERLGDLFGEATPPETTWTLPWAPRPALPWDAPRAAVLVAAGNGATESVPSTERFWATVARGAKPTDWLATFAVRPQV